jgi:hypothetical protein
MPLDEAGLGVALDEEGPGSEGMSPEALQLAIEGLRDEIEVIRESLMGNTALMDVLERSPDFMREMARGEFMDFCSALKELVDGCLATLARIPHDEAAAAVAPSPARTPAQPPPAPPPAWPASVPAAPAVAPTAVPAPAPPPVSAPRPAMSAPWPAPSAPPVAAAVPPPPAPEPPPAEVTGPDYQHRSEEEAVHDLQEFFNTNSPEGTLVKADDREFTRMVAQIVGVICVGITFTPADLATRIRVLRDTFGVRKRLNNKLTLREFKSFFGMTR